MVPISGIITHPSPHLDELVGLAELYEFGETKYPGVREAIENRRIEFKRDRELTVPLAEYEATGKILLGVGHGKFDEHESATTERKEHECCATLVAKDLGNVPPEWDFLLEYVRNVDLNPIASPFDLATLVKDMNEETTDTFAVINWAFAAIRAKVAKQRNFLAAADAVKKGKIEFIDIGQGKPVKMLSVSTDSTSVGPYNRSENGPKAAILVQQNSKGQVQIFTQMTARICLDKVAKELNQRESDRWYYGKSAGHILNGSQTSANTPATNIPFGDILNIIRKNITRFSK